MKRSLWAMLVVVLIIPPHSPKAYFSAAAVFSPAILHSTVQLDVSMFFLLTEV